MRRKEREAIAKMNREQAIREQKIEEREKSDKLKLKQEKERIFRDNAALMEAKRRQRERVRLLSSYPYARHWCIGKG